MVIRRQREEPALKQEGKSRAKRPDGEETVWSWGRHPRSPNQLVCASVHK